MKVQEFDAQDTDELRRLAAEEEALTDTFGPSGLAWYEQHPAPAMTIGCKRCGSARKHQLDWGAVRQELKLHGFVPDILFAESCEQCEAKEEHDD